MQGSTRAPRSLTTPGTRCSLAAVLDDTRRGQHGLKRVGEHVVLLDRRAACGLCCAEAMLSPLPNADGVIVLIEDREIGVVILHRDPAARDGFIAVDDSFE